MNCFFTSYCLTHPALVLKNILPSADISIIIMRIFLFFRFRRQPRGVTVMGPSRGEPSADKTRIVCGGEYGYAHVWELQQLHTTPPNNDTQTSELIKHNSPPSRCPEFGQHLLLKCPNGNLKCKEHCYQCPRSVKEGVDVLHDLPPFYHEFDDDAETQALSVR